MRAPVDDVAGGAAWDAGGWLGELRVAVVATNADGTIVRWDHGAQALLGYPSREVVGRPIADLLHPAPTAASAGPCGTARPPAMGSWPR
ncbi:PAS domain-containing protein [Streptomyces mirabilis]|nr:PAS domain-containing protein [Streptomyces mirabilis]